jgi:hypothetical protein
MNPALCYPRTAVLLQLLGTGRSPAPVVVEEHLACQMGSASTVIPYPDHSEPYDRYDWRESVRALRARGEDAVADCLAQTPAALAQPPGSTFTYPRWTEAELVALLEAVAHAPGVDGMAYGVSRVGEAWVVAPTERALLQERVSTRCDPRYAGSDHCLADQLGLQRTHLLDVRDLELELPAEPRPLADVLVDAIPDGTIALVEVRVSPNEAYGRAERAAFQLFTSALGFPQEPYVFPLGALEYRGRRLREARRAVALDGCARFR